MLRQKAEKVTLCIISLIMFALYLGSKLINNTLDIEINSLSMNLYLYVGCGVLLIVIFSVLIENKITKGIKYFIYHYRIKRNIEFQMIDAGFGIKRLYYIELPVIKIEFNEDFSTGKVKLKNALKFEKKLENIEISSALGKYVVERQYKSNDGNEYIYELLDSRISYKQTFEQIEEFLEYNNLISKYKIFLDDRTKVKLQHCLLVGQTGSGKTYLLYSLILQMLNKEVDYELFYADPKGSSLAVIGELLAPRKTAIEINEIIGLLEEFVAILQMRKRKLKELLKEKIDADYTDFGLTPYVFLIDEYASFVSVLQAEDKKTRDKVKALIYEIILQGRQLGCFMILIMQKSDASLIDTAIRDNMPLKIVLGNSEQQTYVTTFGAGANIPNRNYLQGEGVFTEPTLAREPRLVQAPYFKFDILDAIKQNPRYVITGVP